MFAQEEFSKAFVFYLVREEIAQLSKPLLRAVHDHSCKHLVGMIMDYMIMPDGVEIERRDLIMRDKMKMTEAQMEASSGERAKFRHVTGSSLMQVLNYK